MKLFFWNSYNTTSSPLKILKICLLSFPVDTDKRWFIDHWDLWLFPWWRQPFGSFSWQPKILRNWLLSIQPSKSLRSKALLDSGRTSSLAEIEKKGLIARSRNINFLAIADRIIRLCSRCPSQNHWKKREAQRNRFWFVFHHKFLKTRVVHFSKKAFHHV